MSPMTEVTLSTEALKAIVQQAVEDALIRLLNGELEAELRLRPDIQERLTRYRTIPPQTVSVEEVLRTLGIDD
jgi:hypothetical protein